jgi:hypothetical protein
MINTRRIAVYYNIFTRLSPFIVTLDRELRMSVVKSGPPDQIAFGPGAFFI